MTTPTREQIAHMIHNIPEHYSNYEYAGLNEKAVDAAADAILALFAEQTARVEELEAALTLVKRGFDSGHLQDQTIMVGGDEDVSLTCMSLAGIVTRALGEKP